MNAATLGPLALEAPPDVARRMAERTELMRIACQRTICMADGGAFVDREHLAWCRQFVKANPPLTGPLGTGEPR